MPAVSKAQQRLFGMALSVKRGDSKLSDMPNEIRDEIKSIVDSMTEAEIKKFASTDTSNLPDKVEEEGATLGYVVGQSPSSEGMYLGRDAQKRELTDEEKRMLLLSKNLEDGGVKIKSFKEFKESLDDL